MYRVEIRAASSDGIAWVTSNPIYVRAAEAGADPPARPPATAAVPLFDGRIAPAWHVEHDSASLAELDVAPTVDRAELRLRYGLGGGSLAGQFAALVVDTPGGVARSDRVAFGPSRASDAHLSAAASAGADTAGERCSDRSTWTESKGNARYFDDLTPTGATDLSPPSNRSAFCSWSTRQTRSRAHRAASGSTRWLWRDRGNCRFQVLTVRIMYAAAAPKRMLGAQAARRGAITPPSPSAPKMLSMIQ